MSKQVLIKLLESKIKELPKRRVHLGGYYTGKKDAYLTVIEELKKEEEKK